MDVSGAPVVWTSCGWAWGFETIVMDVAEVQIFVGTSCGWPWGVETVVVAFAEVPAV